MKKMFFQATMPMPQNIQDWENSPSEKLDKLHESVYDVPKVFVVDKESQLYFDQTNGLTLKDYHKWQKRMLG